GWTDAANGAEKGLPNALRFATPEGEHSIRADAVVLALGGGSWARLGSDGAWVPLLERQGIRVAALQPSNCGFDAGWSGHFAQRFAGHPVKSVVASCTDEQGREQRRRSEERRVGKECRYWW